eukprot:1159145-Pelagomonas_calceolata.AAC.28
MAQQSRASQVTPGSPRGRPEGEGTRARAACPTPLGSCPGAPASSGQVTRWGSCRANVAWQHEHHIHSKPLGSCPEAPASNGQVTRWGSCRANVAWKHEHHSSSTPIQIQEHAGVDQGHQPQ